MSWLTIKFFGLILWSKNSEKVLFGNGNARATRLGYADGSRGHVCLAGIQPMNELRRFWLRKLHTLVSVFRHCQLCAQGSLVGPKKFTTDFNTIASPTIDG